MSRLLNRNGETPGIRSVIVYGSSTPKRCSRAKIGLLGLVWSDTAGLPHRLRADYSKTAFTARVSAVVRPVCAASAALWGYLAVESPPCGPYSANLGRQSPSSRTSGT